LRAPVFLIVKLAETLPPSAFALSPE